MNDQATQPRLILAPLRGFTDYIFRNAFRRHFEGFDSALAPFIPTVSAGRYKPAHIRDVLPQNNKGLAVVPQIIANRAPDFLLLTAILQDNGYDTVNWNLGCPFPMVARKKRGCGLLPYPELIDAFLERVCAEMPGRISVKMRLGRHHADEITRLIPILNRYPLKEIIIHPRTGAQMYTGEVDLDAFEDCLGAIDHPVVYNGDIDTTATFGTLSNRFGDAVSGWMIGRGALVNPFLPAAIKCGNDSFEDKLERFQRFYDELFDGYSRLLQGPGHLLGRMKGFWSYFSGAFVDGRAIEKKIHRAQVLESYLRIVADFFANRARWGV